MAQLEILPIGRTRLLNPRTWQPGDHDIGNWGMVPEARIALIQLDRTDWADFDATFEIIMEYSPTGQDPWRVVGGFKCQCGPATNPDGTPANFVGSDFQIPNVGSTTRQVRGTMRVTDKAKRALLDLVLA